MSTQQWLSCTAHHFRRIRRSKWRLWTNAIVWYFGSCFCPDCLSCCGLLVRNLGEMCDASKSNNDGKRLWTDMASDLMSSMFDCKRLRRCQKCAVRQEIKVSGTVCHNQPDKIFSVVLKIFIPSYYKILNKSIWGWGWGWWWVAGALLVPDNLKDNMKFGEFPNIFSWYWTWSVTRASSANGRVKIN